MTPWTVARQAPLSMGILQAGMLESVTMPSSRGSSQPRDRTRVSSSSCIAGGFFTTEPLGKPVPVWLCAHGKNFLHVGVPQSLVGFCDSLPPRKGPRAGVPA